MYELHRIEDPDYKDKNTHQIYLFLLPTQEHFYFVSFDPAEHKFLKISDYHFNKKTGNIPLEELKQQLPEFSMQFSKKLLCYYHPQFSLVPSEFMKEDISKEVMRLHFTSNETDAYRYEHLEKINSYLVFSEHKEIQKIASVFQPDQTTHLAYPLLKSLLAKNFYQHSNDMYVDVAEDFFTVFLMKSKELQLFNSYPYREDTDVLYQLLNISKQFGLDPELDNYHFSGQITRDSSLYEMIYTYLRYPFFIHKPDAFTYSSVFEEESMHPYFKLFSIASCV
jgi:hypothetical protein